MTLRDKECEPCEGGIPPLSKDEVLSYSEEISEDWRVSLDGKEEDRYGAGRKLERKFKFDDFQKVIGFVNSVADLAEDEGHHPNIHIYYNRVVLELTTHAIDGLSENDFIVAAKVDELLK